jgi:hypothetical protein
MTSMPTSPTGSFIAVTKLRFFRRTGNRSGITSNLAVLQCGSGGSRVRDCYLLVRSTAMFLPPANQDGGYWRGW